jgi:uncharacterized protein (DUF58 family)
MLSFLRQKQSFRFVLVSALLTVAAIVTAMISVVAGQIGEDELSNLGSKTALGLALIIVIYVVPRLARNVRLEYLHSDFSLHLPNPGLFFCVLVLVVTILALSSGNNLLYLVLSVLLATLFVSWLASRLCLGGISVAVRFPDHIFVDEAVPFDTTVTNHKRLLPAFSVAVSTAEHGTNTSTRDLAGLAYFPIVPAKTRARTRIERKFARRGVYPVRGFVVGTKFPFGFIDQRRFIETPSEIVVYPQPKPLDDFFHVLPVTQGHVESRLKGSGSDLYAIRRYLSNDHHHHIDWKATAKTTKLMVREFTRDDDWRVTIALDAHVEKQSADHPQFDEKFERAVTLAASLVNYFISEGAEVRLLTGIDDSGFGLGQMHCYAMFRQLAQITPQMSEDGLGEQIKTMLSPSLGAEEQFRILITPSMRNRLVSQSLQSTHIISFDEL